MLSNSYPRTWLGHALESGSCWEQGPRMTQGSAGCASLVWQSSSSGWCCPEPGPWPPRVPRVSVQEQPFCRDPHPLLLLLFPFPERSLQSCVGISLFSPKSCHHVAKDYQYLSVLGAGRKARPRCAGLRLHSQTLLALKRNRFAPRWGGSGALWRCCWGGSARRTLLRRACTFSCKQKLFWFCHILLFKSLEL